MTPVAQIPDVEKTLSMYLRDDDNLVALGVRVMNHPPKNRETPWVMITQIDAPERTGLRGDHLVDFRVDLDCYAGAEGGLPEASAVTRAVRAAIGAMPEVPHDQTVVTATKINSAPRIPDTEGFESARDRFCVNATITAHSI